MVKDILPLIPPHKKYMEPFAGGAAVFFAKPQAICSILNDTNHAIINLYEQLKQHPDEMIELIASALSSRHLFRKWQDIYKNYDKRKHSKLEWAFSVIYLSVTAFSSNFKSSWSSSRGNNLRSRNFSNLRKYVDRTYLARLDKVVLECCDAVECIKSYDNATTFFYIDPPYFNANMGHYGGYTEKDFTELLCCLVIVKGRWILSSYSSKVLDKYILRNQWHTKCLDKQLYSAQHAKGTHRKTEILTTNYDFTKNGTQRRDSYQHILFITSNSGARVHPINE